jgi:hypothetical protein
MSGSVRLGIGSALALLLAGTVLAAEAPSTRLFLHPSTIELKGPSARHRVLVTALAANGRPSDVTSAATYASQQPAIVAVSPEGEFLARGDGSTRITITYAGQSTVLSVTVKDAGVSRPPSFGNDVVPIFTRMGCNQGACHGKNAGQNGFRLSLHPRPRAAKSTSTAS